MTATSSTLPMLAFSAGAGWSDLLRSDSRGDITAHFGGGQQGATVIQTNFARVIPPAALSPAGERPSVRLPSSNGGTTIAVQNAADAEVDVFPASGGTIGLLNVNAPTILWPGSTITFTCFADGGSWIASTPLYPAADIPVVLASTDAITASTTQTQEGATPIVAAMVDVTVGNAGDGVVLPPAHAGMQIALRNISANTGKVYASNDDTIDGTAGATGISLSDGAVTQFLSFADGQWDSV